MKKHFELILFMTFATFFMISCNSSTQSEESQLGDQNQRNSFEFDGIQRNFSLFLPDNDNDTEKIPLIIYLHATGWTAAECKRYTKLHTAAIKSGFIVVSPNGEPNWNSGIGDGLPVWSTPNFDDVGFINALIDTLNENYNIDLDRIYACGYNNGGFMSYKLACQLSHRIAAIASVGGVMSTSTLTNCNPLSTIPILHIHGTDDQWVSFYGTDGWHSVDETLSYWNSINNCSEADTTILPDLDQEDRCTVEKISNTNCSDESEIILYKVIDGGHTWPGSNHPGFYNAGETNDDINANTLIIDFFNNH